MVELVSLFLTAIKQLYEWFSPSVRPSACLSVCHTFFHFVLITVSSWNFQELLTLIEVMSTHKVQVRSQMSRLHRSKPHVAISGP